MKSQNRFFCLRYFCVVLLSVFLTTACSKDEMEQPGQPDTENPGDGDGNQQPEEPEIPPVQWNDGVMRGFRQNKILDLVLIYQGGTHRADWTPAEMRPYVVHTDMQGRKSWFYDGFLFLEFYDGKEYNFAEGSNGTKNARKQEWEWLANRHFETGKAIPALNTCILQGISELGKPTFKHRVVIGLPEPILNQTDWGELNGNKLYFTKGADRITACKWYVDLLISLFKKQNFENIELAGFYWVSEQMSKNNYITTPVGDYIREKGMQFYWIPYYHSNGFSQWKEYGFDMAYLQPNYFFDLNIGDERIGNACDMAYTHNMGLEMEFDGATSVNSNPCKRDRLFKYIQGFRKYEVLKNSSIAYYEGGGAIRWLSQSSDALNRQVVDTLADIIQERRARLLESIVYEENFKNGKVPSSNYWAVTGNGQSVTPSENGLILSSGGETTRLKMQKKVDLKYGRIEIKARILAKDKTAKLRVRLMPTYEKLGPWPYSGELFLMVFNGVEQSLIRCGANTQRMNETIGNIKESILYINDMQSYFHTYVCEWDEKKITFYVDGMKTNVQEDLFDKKYSSYPEFWPFNEKFYLDISVVSASDEPALCIESVRINKK